MKVIRNYLYNAGYQILAMLAPLITTPYIARVLGAHGVGINSYTNSWVTFFYLIGQMGITLYGNRQIAYVRDDPEKRSRTFWGIECLQAMTITLALISYVVIVQLFSTTFKPYFMWQSLWIIATGLDVSWYFMGMEDFKKTVVRNTAVKLITIALIFLIVKQPTDLTKYITLLGGAQIAGNLTLWPYLRESIHWVPISTWHPFQHFYPSLLLFIPTITTQIYLVVNRLMLGRMSTQASLGQFDSADKIVKIVLAIVTATGTVMLPNVANKFSKGDIKGVRESLYHSFDFVTSISVPLMFGLMAISTKFAPWFLGSQFYPTGKIMFIESPIILFIAWSNVTGTQYLMPVNRVHEYTMSATAGAVSNIIFNLVLIHLWGANGAALATDLSEFLVTTVQLVCIRSTIRRRTLFKDFWRYFLSGLIMFIIVYRINLAIRMSIINLILQVAVGAVIYITGLFVFRAPVLKQAQGLIQNLKK